MQKKAKFRGNNIYSNKYVAIYLFPEIIFMLAFCFYPLLVLIKNAFTDYMIVASGIHFVGLKNFIKILSTPTFYEQLWRTLKFVLVSVSIEMVFGFFLALIFQVYFPLRRLARTLIMIPMSAAPVAMAFLWSFMFNPKMGILNYFLSLIGIQPQLWVADPKTALWSIMLVDIWLSTPFVFLVFSSGMTSLDQDIFEAAYLDGAGFWKMLSTMLIPTLRPIIAVVAMFRIIDAFKLFDLIYTLTGGGPGVSTETINLAIYHYAFRYYEIGYASAYALILFFIVLGMSLSIVKRGKIIES